MQGSHARRTAQPPLKELPHLGLRALAQRRAHRGRETIPNVNWEQLVLVTIRGHCSQRLCSEKKMLSVEESEKKKKRPGAAEIHTYIPTYLQCLECAEDEE